VQELSWLWFADRKEGTTDISQIDIGAQIYMADEWVRKWETNDWTSLANLHIRSLLEQNDLVRRVNEKAIDEVWLATPPRPWAKEGTMFAPTWDAFAYGLSAGAAGPNPVAIPIDCIYQETEDVGMERAYGAHDQLVHVPGLTRRFVMHHMNLAAWNPLHNYCHRVEAVLSHIWGSGWPFAQGYAEQWSTPFHPENCLTPWHLFEMQDNAWNGWAGAGSPHFFPNSKAAYLLDHDDAVPSMAHRFWDFPTGFPLNLENPDTLIVVDKSTWAHLPRPEMWWLQQLPANPGTFDGRHCDWWKYITDVNDETGLNEPVTKPTVGTAKPAADVQVYGSEAIIRFQPKSQDPDNAEYAVFRGTQELSRLRRRGNAHVRLSMRAPLPGPWTVAHVTGRTRVWEQAYQEPGTQPTPTPVPDDVETLAQRWMALDFAVSQAADDGDDIGAALLRARRDRLWAELRAKL
jgi:hypothetical protein